MGVEKTSPVAESGYRLCPVERRASPVAPARLSGYHFTTQLRSQPGEPEIVEDQGSWMPGGEDEASTRAGDVPDTPTSIDETRGRARRVYAPTSRGLLPVGRVADLVCHGVVGLLEAHVPQQLLHAERVGFVLL